MLRRRRSWHHNFIDMYCKDFQTYKNTLFLQTIYFILLE